MLNKKEDILYSLSLAFLSVLFPIFFIAAHNSHEITTISLLLPSIMTGVISSLVIFGIGTLIFRNKSASAIFSFLFSLLFFGYGYTYYFLSKSFAVKNSYLLVIFAIIYLAIFALVFLKRQKFQTNFLKPFVFSLSLLTGFNVIQLLIEFNSRTNVVSEKEQKVTKTNEGQPDIYHFILDGYPSQESFEKILRIDNNSFFKTIREKGFLVPKKSYSNYPVTASSLASLFRYDYITEKDAKLYQLDKEVLTNNTTRFLKARGYKHYNISPGLGGHTTFNPHADYNYQASSIDKFSLHILNSTLARPFMSYFVPSTKAKTVLFSFKTIKELAKKKTRFPKYVLNYQLIPHSPNVFLKDGTIRKSVKSDINPELGRSEIEFFWEEVQYLNTLIYDTIDHIKQHSPNAIIIMQADHGVPFFQFSPNKKYAYKGLYGALIALYMPGKTVEIPKEMTLVNIFRVVFNHYFDARLPLLPNKSYHSEYKDIGNFIDVSEHVYD